jgi:CBS-domain-containing membrane protein
MLTKTKPVIALTAADVMSRAVLTVPRQMPLRDAAGLLWRAGVSEAPVVDELGRCVGALSAIDCLRWAEQGTSGPSDGPAPSCRFQVKGHLLTGEKAVICTLPPESCPLQVLRPTTAGRHTSVCLQPTGVLSDWQQVAEGFSADSVQSSMTSDVVTATPETPLPELARLMIDARTDRVPVIDERGRPVGVASCTDVLAALVRDDLESP